MVQSYSLAPNWANILWPKSAPPHCHTSPPCSFFPIFATVSGASFSWLTLSAVSLALHRRDRLSHLTQHLQPASHMIFSGSQRDAPTDFRDRWEVSSLFLSACLFLFLCNMCHSLTAVTPVSCLALPFILHYWLKITPASLSSFLSFPRPCQLSLPSLLLPQCSCRLHFNLQV